MSTTYTLDDLVTMSYPEIKQVFLQGHAIPHDALDNAQYIGVDICLPKWINKLMWKTFSKTFYRDPATNIIRGWNIKVEQTGWDKPVTPKTKNGKPVTFGHYHLLPAEGKKFPQGWTGADYLDYGVAGNTFFDMARFAHAPIVAVNAGSSQLLLGWEIINVGPWQIPIPDYWALQYQGPIQTMVDRPKP